MRTIDSVTLLFVMLFRRVSCLVVTVLVATQAAHADLVSFGSGVNQFTMEFVTIGNPGNAADTTGSPNPAGAVAYSFQMGKFEVSEDMIYKANAAADLGITISSRAPNRPATNANWNEAARFVNWLNTSQGFQQAYKFTTQPGDVGYSAAYEDISLWVSGDAGFDAANPFRNSLARYVLPSTDEWYKAAYHDATAGTAGVYFDFPTGSDSTPDGIDSIGDPAFDAVFDDVFADGNRPGGPHDITNAGALSPYGTMGQGGNVIEWEETAFDLANRSGSSLRGIRGGWYLGDASLLSASSRTGHAPTGFNDYGLGFRVASVPEPSSYLLLGVVCGGTLIARWMLPLLFSYLRSQPAEATTATV